MTVPEIASVVDVWAKEYSEIGSLPYVNYVQIFENRGEIMGCSNPHPHGQIWGNPDYSLTNLRKRARSTGGIFREETTVVCCVTTWNWRRKKGIRVVVENAHFAAVVPLPGRCGPSKFCWSPDDTFATWNLLIPPRALVLLTSLSSSPHDTTISSRYRFLIRWVFIRRRPMAKRIQSGIFTRSTSIHRCCGSATVRKFMVGYEMLASPQRETSHPKRRRLLPSGILQRDTLCRGDCASGRNL